MFRSTENFVSGVVLELSGRPMLFFARFFSHLADEAAVKEANDIKGASGARPCIKCYAVKTRYAVIDGSIHTVACPDVRRIPRAHDIDVWAWHDELEEQKSVLGIIAFRKFETRRGINLNMGGIVAARDLRQFYLSATHT